MLNEEALATRFVRLQPYNLYKISVRTSQETHCFRSKDQLIKMLFMETVAVYFQNHMTHINTFCGQNAEL
jgi:hypothetical protein